MNETSSGNEFIDRHFALHNRIWELAYLARRDPSRRSELIAACEDQIAIADRLARVLERGLSLPTRTTMSEPKGQDRR